MDIFIYILDRKFMIKLKFNVMIVYVVYCIKYGNRDEIEKKNLKVVGNILNS